MNPFRTMKVDSLSVKAYDSKKYMDQAATRFVADQIHKVLAKKDHVNLMLATDTSQLTFIDAFNHKWFNSPTHWVGNSNKLKSDSN